MKSIKSILVFAFLFTILISIGAYATAPQTIVTGKVYIEGTTTPVKGADVTVTCHHGGQDIVKSSDPTSEHGYYAVFFDQETECDHGDTVDVYAEKEGVGSGSRSGTVDDDVLGDFDIAVICVSIPEFSAVAAGIALVGAIAGFIFLRKRN